VRTRVSGKFSKAAEEFACTLETGWATVGAPQRDSRGSSGTKVGVLHILPQALVVEPPVVVLANAFLAALNGLRLLAPVALLRDLATALEASLAKVVDALVEASTKAFLVPFVRSGLSRVVWF
jgi:hypothetical protein